MKLSKDYKKLFELVYNNEDITIPCFVDYKFNKKDETEKAYRDIAKVRWIDMIDVGARGISYGDHRVTTLDHFVKDCERMNLEFVDFDVKKEVSDEEITDKANKMEAGTSWCHAYSFEEGAKWMRSESPVRIARFPVAKKNENDNETNEAKLRNQLSPFYNLADIVIKLEAHPELLKIVIDEAKQVKNNKSEIDRLLNIIDSPKPLLTINMVKDFSDEIKNRIIHFAKWHDIESSQIDGKRKWIDWYEEYDKLFPFSIITKYCECPEPDRETGFSYCMKCHRHVSNERMDELTKD